MERHPVMLIAGKSDPAAAVSAYEAGADDVILQALPLRGADARIARRSSAPRP